MVCQGSGIDYLWREFVDKESITIDSHALPRIWKSSGVGVDGNGHVSEGGGHAIDNNWSLHHRNFTVMGFSPKISAVHEKRSSNAQLYDYRRTSGDLSFVKQF